MSHSMPRDFHSGREPQPQLQPTRIFQRPASALTNTSADDLRHREHATAAMVRTLDEKIGRLTSARAARLNALNKIRSALAQAILAGHSDPERHAN
jgi:hypothetical protein